MTYHIHKSAHRLLFMGLAAAAALSACNPEPDESDLYTFTGETIESWIQQDSSLTSFNYMMSRIGYDNMMAAYGRYTVFAPTNEGVAAYIDSLWNDPEATLPHNGMTEHSLQGLTDSLCRSIVRYHMCDGLVTGLTMSQGADKFGTMLGYDVQYDPSSGHIVLNDKATITSSDNEVTNGLIHVLDQVIPRSTRFIGDILMRDSTFSIFSEALQRTHLADSIMRFMKDKTYTYTTKKHPSAGTQIYAYDYCKVGYTVFAERDEELAKIGVHSFDDLVRYANRVYGEPGTTPEWYDYMKEKGLTIADNSDFTARTNALNMFVAYHILYAAMDAHHLVYEPHANDAYWNYAKGGTITGTDLTFENADPYDYYETMLPHTLMKIWMPMRTYKSANNPVYINRYVANNTLTNKLASMGDPAMHQLVYQGMEVDKNTGLTAFNGYVLPVKVVQGSGKALVYDEQVPKGVLNERMRFDACTFLPEMINNGIRDIVSTNKTGYDDSRFGIPTDYFDNMEVYSAGTIFNYCNHGAWRCYQTDQIQIWGKYDFAIKLPPVPSGIYEVRIVSPPLSYGGMTQYYIGTSRNVQSMTALGIPFDMTISGTDPRIGWTNFLEEDDYGIATDVAMRNRGYMRAPFSFCGHGDNGWTSGGKTDTGELITGNNCRAEGGDGTMLIRRILDRGVEIKQGNEVWLRIKTLQENESLLSMLDFIELVPTIVTDNDTYTEDWY